MNTSTKQIYNVQAVSFHNFNRLPAHRGLTDPVTGRVGRQLQPSERDCIQLCVTWVGHQDT